MAGTLSYWQARARAHPVEADVVIVGAGIVGASAAYWLHAMKPQLRVALVDAGRIGAGASGRNAGLLLRGTALSLSAMLDGGSRSDALWLFRFTDESITRLLERTQGGAYELTHSGSLLAAGDAREDEALATVAEELRRAGYPVEHWSGAKVRDRLSGGRYVGGVYDPGGAAVDPLRLVDHLVASSSAEVYQDHAAHAIEPRTGGRCQVECAPRAFIAPTVLLALNAYLPRLVPDAASLVRPVRAQMLAARTETSFRLPMPVYSHEGYYYARSTAEGALLVGGGRHLHVDVEVGYEDATTPELQRHLEDYVREHLPQCGPLIVSRRWSGTMGFSPDGTPLIGKLPEMNVHYAAGFTGHGMAFGFGIGRLLARLALGEDGGSDAAHFSANRPALNAASQKAV